MIRNSILNNELISWIWGSKYELDVTTFLPTNVPYPEIPISFGELRSRIPTIESIYESIEPAYEKFMLKIDETVYGLEKSVDFFRRDMKWKVLNLRNIPSLLPEDYNPPQYIGSNINVRDLESEKELHANLSNVSDIDFFLLFNFITVSSLILKSFVVRSTSALDEFLKFKNNFTSAASEIEMPKINITAIKDRTSNVNLSFENMTEPDIEFELWFLKFGSISDVLFLVDFVFRSYFTIRMFFKYWDVGSIKLPEIDVRVHKEIKNPFKMSNGRLIFLLFTNPLIGALMFAVVLIWVLSFVSSVYTPLYVEYSNGCIPADGNGTFTTANIYSMSYNLAYQSGSSSLLKELESFDSERTSMCSKLYTSSVTKQNQDMLQLRSYSKSLESTNEQVELFKKCINSESIDEMFHLACCGRVGYEECSDDNSTKYTCPLNNDLEKPIPYNLPGKVKIAILNRNLTILFLLESTLITILSDTKANICLRSHALTSLKEIPSGI